MIVVDPRVTKTAMMADLHLPVKPRSDIALLNGIAHVLIREGLIDRAYIEANTTGFEEFSAFVADFTPERVAEVTGLSQYDILHTARLYGNAKAAFIGWTMGVNHSTQGAVTVAAINNLALITGNMGRSGAAPFSITGQCNAMGTREAGFTSSLPGYRKFESGDRSSRTGKAVEHRRGSHSHGARPGVSRHHRRRGRGQDQSALVHRHQPGGLLSQLRIAGASAAQRGLYGGAGWLSSHAHRRLCPPGSARGHLGEKEGTYTNSERRISKVNALVAPPGEARTDFDIFLAIAEKLGVKDELYPGWAIDA